MRSKHVVVLMLVLAASLCSHGAAASKSTGVYDLASDFALTQTPHSIWQYGYSATRSTDPGQFRNDLVVDMTNPIGFWHSSTAINTGVMSGYYPYVAHNPTRSTRVGPVGGWAVRPGEVAMEANGNGLYSLVRFVTPHSGIYH
ncbi:MAG: hypothetical protein ACLQVD_14475, partial [Capsulimonadaceae bacterium]